MNTNVLARMRPRWLAAAAVALLTPVIVYSAIDADIFEIDGNALTSGTGDDWDKIALGTSSASPGVFEVDGSNPERIFTGGGSKDERDISGGNNVWQNTTGSAPDKNNLEHAFAGAYHNANNDLLIYFGADRFDNSGDSAIGFWFFQDSVSVNTSNGTFTGKHVVGDILITSDFRNGGGVSVINVFKWVGGANPLQLLISGSPAQPGGANTPSCLAKSGVDVACAISNRIATPIPATWPGGYVFKGGGNNGNFPISTLFEGGINISQLLGTSNTCFASFLAMTRTSASTTAQLKDFVVGQFPLCGISVAKSCDGSTTISPDGEHFRNSFTVSVTNTGTGTVFNPAFAETATLDSDYVCKLTKINGNDIAPVTLAKDTPVKLVDTLAAQATATGTVVCDTLDNPFDNSVSAQAFATNPAVDQNALKLTADPVSTDPLCPPFQFAGQLAIEKKCAHRFDGDGNLLTPAVTMDANLIAKVCVDIKVTNNSNQKVTGITITDDQVDAGDMPAAFALDPAASKLVQDLCYTPEQGDDPTETIPHNITFTDHASASGTGVLSKDTVASSETSVTCPLCTDPDSVHP